MKVCRCGAAKRPHPQTTMGADFLRSFILELLAYPAIYLLWHGRLVGENSRMTFPDAEKDLN